MAWPSDPRVSALQSQVKSLELEVDNAAKLSQQAEEAKKTSKNKVKMWMTDFEAKEGRPPTNQDKATVRDMFVEYKATETNAKSASDELLRLQLALEAARKEMEALSPSVPAGSAALYDPVVLELNVS